MLIPICIPAGKCVSLPYERSPIRTYRAMGLLFACLFPPKTAGLHAQTATTTWHVGKTTCTCGRKRPACRKKKRGLRKNLPRPKQLNILTTSQKSIKGFSRPPCPACGKRIPAETLRNPLPAPCKTQLPTWRLQTDMPKPTTHFARPRLSNSFQCLQNWKELITFV